MVVARRTGSLPTSLNQVGVTYDELKSLHRDLIRADADERRSMPGLEPRRADVVPAGSALLLTAMQLFDFDSMTVGDWALREGMALDALRRSSGGLDPRTPHTIRDASVVDLARRCGWPEDHSRHVAELATSLFDQTRDLHGLDDGAGDLLRYGALLHDVGEHVSVENNAKHSAYLIEHGRLRGFDPGEVAVLACLGRYHRRGEPSKSAFDPYARLPGERRRLVDLLVPLLQVAHGLDHARTSAVEDIDVDLTDDTVLVAAVAATDADLELWGAGRTRKRFERVYKRDLRFTAVPAGDLGEPLAG
jgi:exopolyphosphatase/guanosine-5'-triphosphate,3'-diphosphate pyrophosphatase